MPSFGKPLALFAVIKDVTNFLINGKDIISQKKE
jgi:hypothetical protein